MCLSNPTRSLQAKLDYESAIRDLSENPNKQRFCLWRRLDSVGPFCDQVRRIDMTRQKYVEWAVKCLDVYMAEENRKYYEGFAYKTPETPYTDRVKSLACSLNEAQRLYMRQNADKFVRDMMNSSASALTDCAGVAEPIYRSPLFAKGPIKGRILPKSNRLYEWRVNLVQSTTTLQEVPMNNIPKNCYVLLCLSSDSPRLLYPKMVDSGDVKFANYHDEITGAFVFDRNDISEDELRPLAAKYHAVFICKLVDVIHFQMKSLTQE